MILNFPQTRSNRVSRLLKLARDARDEEHAVSQNLNSTSPRLPHPRELPKGMTERGTAVLSGDVPHVDYFPRIRRRRARQIIDRFDISRSPLPTELSGVNTQAV